MERKKVPRLYKILALLALLLLPLNLLQTPTSYAWLDGSGKEQKTLSDEEDGKVYRYALRQFYVDTKSKKAVPDAANDDDDQRTWTKGHPSYS